MLKVPSRHLPGVTEGKPWKNLSGRSVAGCRIIKQLLSYRNNIVLLKTCTFQMCAYSTPKIYHCVLSTQSRDNKHIWNTCYIFIIFHVSVGYKEKNTFYSEVLYDACLHVINMRVALIPTNFLSGILCRPSPREIVLIIPFYPKLKCVGNVQERRSPYIFTLWKP